MTTARFKIGDHAYIQCTGGPRLGRWFECEVIDMVYRTDMNQWGVVLKCLNSALRGSVVP